MSDRIIALMGRATAFGCAAALGCAVRAPVKSSSAPQRAEEHPTPVSGASVSNAPAKTRDKPSSECNLNHYIERAEQLRKLPIKGPISCQLEPQRELSNLAVQVALRDTPKAWLDGQVQFLRLMGFASEQFDMVDSLRALTEEQLAGFYDPTGNILYVSKDLDPENSDMALVHEVVHALQDQHFDLGRRMAEAKTSDELSALQLLAEGDATSAMIDMPRGSGQIPQAIIERLSEFGAFIAQASVSEVEVPALLRRSILAPYADGLALIEQLRAAGDWASVNALWQSAPHTTSELLHPGRPRVAVTLPAVPPWRQHAVSYDDVTGEQTVRLVLEEWDSLAGAAASADGLLADRLSVFSAAEGSALSWQMAFQTREDVDQVIHSLKKGPFKAAGSSRSMSADRSLTRGCDNDTSGNPMALLRDGLRVVLVVQSRNVESPALACHRLVDWARAGLTQTAR